MGDNADDGYISSPNSAMGDSYLAEKEAKQEEQAKRKEVDEQERQDGGPLQRKKPKSNFSTSAPAPAPASSTTTNTPGKQQLPPAVQAALANIERKQKEREAEAKQEVEIKRKSLWGSKKKSVAVVQPSANNWESASFDGDASKKAKFMALMGAKNKGAAAPAAGTAAAGSTDTTAAKAMQDLERQYEVSRTTNFAAHKTGLGFGNRY